MENTYAVFVVRISEVCKKFVLQKEMCNVIKVPLNINGKVFIYKTLLKYQWIPSIIA